MTSKCTVCYEEIKTPEFLNVQEFDCVDFEDPSCLRLKCGHAYHTNCIMQAFRSNLKCPVCRIDLIESGKANDDNYIQIFANEEDSDDDINQNNLLIKSTLNLERTKNKELKEYRKKLKCQIKDFNKYHTELKHKRKTTVKECLKTFRKSEQKTFHSKMKEVNKIVQVIKKNEKSIATEKLLKNGIVEELDIDMYFDRFNQDYYVYSLLQKNGGDINLNGFTRRFWGV